MAKNDYEKIVNAITQYVYENVDSQVSLDQLAQQAKISKYHLNRIFAASTGIPLGDYIQRHRLRRALRLFEQGNHNVIDVALSVGYESASSFTRAFRNVLGATPTEVITKQRKVSLQSTKKVRFESGQTIEPEWIERPSQKVFGLIGEGFSGQSYIDIANQLFSQLNELSDPISYEARGVTGASLDEPWTSDHKTSRFFAGYASGLSLYQDKLTTLEFGEGTYLRFLHKGSYATLWQTISKIYSQWVLKHGVQLKDQYIIQQYLNNPTVTPIGELETFLLLWVES